MESLTRSLNYELPQELHFSNDNVQHILQNSPSSSSTANIPITTITLNSTPAITATTTTYQSGQTAAHLLTNSVAKDFLHKLGATLLNSIQLQSYHHQQQQQQQQLSNTFTTNLSSVPASSTAALLTVHHHQQPSTLQTDMDFIGNHLSLDTKNYEAMDELQKQLEYDKFMNEVWIGVVLTLIFISMIFCFCSCFLYHQFIIWKRNYRSTLVQSQSLSDIESIKSSLEFNDPVPEYTLVSGLPSYEAALELLRKTKQPCLLVHPSVFNIFEKSSNNDDLSNIIVKNAATSDTTKNVPINNSNEVTTPLLTEMTVTTTHHHNTNHSSGILTNVTAMTHVNEKSPQQQQQRSPGMAITPTTVAAPTTLMTDKATHSNKLGAVEKCCKS